METSVQPQLLFNAVFVSIAVFIVGRQRMQHFTISCTRPNARQCDNSFIDFDTSVSPASCRQHSILSYGSPISISIIIIIESPCLYARRIVYCCLSDAIKFGVIMVYYLSTIVGDNIIFCHVPISCQQQQPWLI